MKQPRVGLLPMYVKLYDESMPELRGELEPFVNDVAQAIRTEGIEVLVAKTSRISEEFETELREFKEADVDAVVTLHLAYSPSLESFGPLRDAGIPIVVLDTTPADSFTPRSDPSELMANHGIHGVQDLCNLLTRERIPFSVHAGQIADKEMMARLASTIRGAQVATALEHAHVAQIGPPFEGMGDFRVDSDELASQFGITVIPFDETALPVSEVSASQVSNELDYDRRRFLIDASVTHQEHELSTRTGLAIRSWLTDQNVTAFTLNFTSTSAESPYLPVMPFMECSKAMERGIGYAGEGDVLTAAWVGALLGTFPETTFTEMFCPDWSGNSVFLSHMGEFNYRVAAEPPILRKLSFPYTSASDPIVGFGTLRPGRATLANLSPGPGGGYRIILTSGEMLPVAGPNSLETLLNGWFKPDTPLPEFLERFSEMGGIHHSALIYGEEATEVVRAAGRFLSVETVTI